MAPTTVEARRALEALRNGVPNRDAVKVLGCNQPDVERAFLEQLHQVGSAALAGKQVPGLLVEGGFGTGKSHLLEYLEHKALAENFVCSRVVISKETPLYDPGKVFNAAVGSAVVPGQNGQAIQEIAHRLDPKGDAHGDLYRWADRKDSGISNVFAATLLVHERLNNDPELVEEITNFWAGQKLSIQRIRQGLKQVAAQHLYQVKAVPVRELGNQRFLFASRLIRAAGYSGWVLLIDEVELIGRYSLLQRGRSYAELARWLGKVDSLQCPGVAVVAAITDDFALYVLDEKDDERSIGPRLRDKGTEEMTRTAARAEIGMRAIKRESVRLATPDAVMLDATRQIVRRVHGAAHGWDPPTLASGDDPTRPMRAHVRRWINEWDLVRLYPDAQPSTEQTEVRSEYGEDQTLEQGSEGDEAEE